MAAAARCPGPGLRLAAIPPGLAAVVKDLIGTKVGPRSERSTDCGAVQRTLSTREREISRVLNCRCRWSARMQRIKELDSIRGLAAIAIMVYHLWFRQIGILGSAVDLFFVLSGYLITSIILANALSERFSVHFLHATRLANLADLLPDSACAWSLINPFLPPCGNLEDLPYYLTFTQEITHYRPSMEPSLPSAFRHTWSLAIEEQFYLFWPPLLWWFGSKRLPVASMLLVVAARLRSRTQLQCSSADHALRRPGARRTPGRHSGRCTRASRRKRAEVSLRMGILGVVSTSRTIAVITLPGLLNSRWPSLVPDAFVRVLKPLCLNLMFFALVATIVSYAGITVFGWLRDRRLVYLGSISYGIYLYHHFMFEVSGSITQPTTDGTTAWSSILARCSLSIGAGGFLLEFRGAADPWAEGPIPAIGRPLRRCTKIGSGIDDIRGVQVG